MTQEAVVIKELSSGNALVSVSRKTACGGHCENCESCIVQSDVCVTASNQLHARTGDSVVIESRSSRIYQALLLVYIFPLVLMLMGFAIGSTISQTESICVILAFIGFLFGAFLVAKIGKRYQRRPITYSIIEIIQR